MDFVCLYLLSGGRQGNPAGRKGRPFRFCNNAEGRVTKSLTGGHV